MSSRCIFKKGLKDCIKNYRIKWLLSIEVANASLVLFLSSLRNKTLPIDSQESKTYLTPCMGGNGEWVGIGLS